jgi:hypothetical protein
MAKAVLPRSKQFKVPPLPEVEQYIAQKKPEWPTAFVEYYAFKFWNHYEASGWRLSSGNPVKNWQACFNANWQNVKFLEDVQMLDKYTKRQEAEKKSQAAEQIQSLKIQAGVPEEITPEYLDSVLTEFKKNYQTFPVETLAALYPWLKKRGLIKLTKEESDSIKQVYGAKPVEGMAACVKATLVKMVNYSITFAYIFRK